MNKKHKKKISKFDSYLPEIKVNPNLQSDSVNWLPKIKYEASGRFSESDRKSIIKRLKFVDNIDLVGLSKIRILDKIKMQYDGESIGCYYRKTKTSEAEIWLSYKLFKTTRKIFKFFEQFIHSDKIIETLYHEIGHHKAAISHSISAYKGEAFAEKYMEAYKKAWFKEYGPSKFGLKVFRYCTIWIPYLIKWIAYLLRKRFSMSKLIYEYLNKELTWDEFSERVLTHRQNKNKKKKMNKNKLHPLSRIKYRKKFKINRW